MIHTLYEFATSLGGYGWGGLGMSLPERLDAAPDADAKPKVGDAVERQQAWTGAWASGLVPAFDDAPPTTLHLLFRMWRYSVLALGVQAVVAPIRAGTQTLEIRKRDGTVATAGERRGPVGDGVKSSPEDRLKADAERVFADQWPLVYAAIGPKLVFGRWEFETIWSRVDGLTVPRQKSFGLGEFLAGTVRPLEFNQEFAGLAYAGGAKGEQRLPPERCLHLIANGMLDPVSGVSWLEAAKADWWRAENTLKNIERLGRKASGINMLIHIDGSMEFRDAAGNAVTAQAEVQKLVNALASGGTYASPRLMFRHSDIVKNPELAKIHPVEVDQFNWGSQGADMSALAGLVESYNKAMLRAMTLPERALTEATTGGSRADSETHGASMGNVSELVHADVLSQFNRQTFDTFLVTNKGPDWRGRLFWKPAQSGNDDKGFKQGLIGKAVGNPADPAFHMLDRPRLFAETETPFDHEWEKKADAAKADAEKAQKAAGLPGGEKPANGKTAVAVNGLKPDAKPGSNGNGRLAALAGAKGGN